VGVALMMALMDMGGGGGCWLISWHRSVLDGLC